jgi:hypothetical protein
VDHVDAEVGLLIGSDVPEALEPKETIKSQGRGPYATRTIFGWIINSPLGTSSNGKQYTANYIKTEDASLEEQFQNYCNTEFNELNKTSKPSLLQEDKRALDIMNDISELKNGHYEIALPWKKPSPDMPSNRSI